MFRIPPAISTMSLGDLKRFIKTGEGTFLEFKRTISSPEKIAREVCAFANTKGGTLLIGVDDNRTLIGVDSYYEEGYQLIEALTVLCDPPLDYKIELLEMGDREIVIVKVEEAEKKPVYVKHNGKSEVYIRDKDKSVRASKERAALLRSQNRDRGITFEFGENEQRLFRYLNEYQKITVDEYARLINRSKYKSSRILIDLVSLGVLSLFSKNDQEYFTHSNKPF
ncbi:Putative DNA-binding domain-containing protein [Cyclonatronum proteinivorum]|uniref:DNA-binding domain-containing protein n=1 Tax=Cyclonatronum proteinivorum TaxID=1457365 RepID=A0A345UGP6_9BACT|nr:ATP-binding protein [Cyclonatronum proteinivorum]AXI99647.1 Putative DNA-binding domain-containing protein [Cyclonatronum proteinivorum]